MVKVKVGTNLSMKEVIVSETETVRNILESNGVNYVTATVTIDCCPVGLGDLDKSLSDLGIADECYIIASVKTDNAKA